MISTKGQASFEMMLVLAVILVLSVFAFGFGLRNNSNMVAYLFLHNTYDEFKVKNNGPLMLSVQSNEKDNVLDFNIKTKDLVKTDLKTFNRFAKDLNNKIVQRTKYKNVNINFN